MPNPYAYRLIRARENIGYLQEEAANLLGIPVEDLASYERGNKAPSEVELRNMAQMYHVESDFLTAEIAEGSRENWPITENYKNGILRGARIRSHGHYFIEEAAAKLNIDEHQLFLYEYGAEYPDDELLINMGVLYGVPYNNLAKVKSFELIMYFTDSNLEEMKNGRNLKLDSVNNGNELLVKFYIGENAVSTFSYSPEKYRILQKAVNVCMGGIIEDAEKLGIELKSLHINEIRPKLTALFEEFEKQYSAQHVEEAPDEEDEDEGFYYAPIIEEPREETEPGNGEENTKPVEEAAINEPDEMAKETAVEYEGADREGDFEEYDDEEYEKGSIPLQYDSDISEVVDITLTPQEKVSSLFKFIRALNASRQRIVKNYRNYPWAKPISELPKDEENIVTYYRDKVDNESPDASPWLLIVRKPEFEACPTPDDSFSEWIVGDWKSFRDNVSVINEKYYDGLGIEVTGQRLIELQAKINETFYGIESVDGDYTLEKFTDDEEREKAFKKWIAVRTQWIERQKVLDSTRKLFSELHQQYVELERESETLELIVANGFIKDRDDPEVNQAILTRRVAIKYDATNNVICIEDAEVDSDLYSEIFQAVNGLNLDQIDQLHDELVREDFHPLDRNDSPDYLKRMIHYFSSDSFFSEDGVPEGWEREHRFLMYLMPTYIVRKRGDGSLKAIEKILKNIDDTGEIPKPIQEIVSGGKVEPPDDTSSQTVEEQLAAVGGESLDVLLSKEANREQLIIAQRIEKYNAVLVQGPPGTGKTHTIANLLGHFLAQGKSVLVTSYTKKALTVLKEQVSPGIQNLCVSVLEDNNRDMEKAVDGITSYLADNNSISLSKKMQDSQLNRSTIIGELAKVRKDLFRLINQEANSIVYNGEDISPSAAAQFVLDNAKTLDYIPGKVKYPNALPLTFDELSVLYRSNEAVDLKAESELALDLPNPTELLSYRDFSEICEAIGAKEEAIDKIRDKYSWKIYNHLEDKNISFKTDTGKKLEVPYPDVNNLNALIEYIADFRIVKDWMIAAAVDGKRGKSYKQRWLTLVDTIKKASNFAESLVGLTFGKTIEQSTEFNVLNYQKEFIEIRDNGGTVNKFQRKLKKRYDEALRSISIDGHEPSNTDECNIAVQYIQLAILREQCSRFWQDLFGDYDVPAFYELHSKNPEEVASNWIKQIERYSFWYENEYGKLKDLLIACNIKPDTIFPVDNLDSETDQITKILKTVSTELVPICDAIKAAICIAEYGDSLTNTREVLTDGRRESSTICDNLLRALDNLNENDYYDAFNELDRVYNKQDLQEKREEYLNILQPYATQWADAIRNRTGIHGQASVPDNIEDAWRWKQYSAILADIAKEPYAELQEKSIRLSKEYREATAEYAEYSAWYHLAKRTETDINLRHDLQGWKLTEKKLGKGNVKRAAELREEARRLMANCQIAVPAWIMPISKALESFDPSKNQFDIIIVDEASQADISALAILYMGKKLVIVGDDKQVSPMAIGQQVDRIDKLQKEFIKGRIPNGILYDGQSSIYDVALTTFQPLMLREHFRCVPEIIGFSNMLSYDHKILPLRDAGSSNLLPAVVNYRVADGKRLGNTKINKKEALNIVMLLKACIEQPEYSGKTFGVISLLGEEQAKLIQKYIFTYIEPQEIEKRKIISGISSNFQGDERDVVFLSVVDSGNENGPLRMTSFGQGDAYRKRYNVAASRAKDQLWVVHSLDAANDLQPGDLRKRLIDYAANPNAIEQRYSEIAAHADSPFEVAVCQKLVERGYHIVQQWPVGAYRLDIVALCGEKKVAIECDGERFHSGEDKIREDMERQTILERTGWRFIRIRGSEFFMAPDKTMDRVFSELNTLGVFPEDTSSEDATERTSNLLEKVKIRAQELLEPAINDLEKGIDLDTIAAALSSVGTKKYDPQKYSVEQNSPRGRPPINRTVSQTESVQMKIEDIKPESAPEKLAEQKNQVIRPKTNEQSMKDKFQNLLDGFK